jgi:hypothetical protein
MNTQLIESFLDGSLVTSGVIVEDDTLRNIRTRIQTILDGRSEPGFKPSTLYHSDGTFVDSMYGNAKDVRCPYSLLFYAHWLQRESIVFRYMVKMLTYMVNDGFEIISTGDDELRDYVEGYFDFICKDYMGTFHKYMIKLLQDLLIYATTFTRIHRRTNEYARMASFSYRGGGRPLAPISKIECWSPPFVTISFDGGTPSRFHYLADSSKSVPAYNMFAIRVFDMSGAWWGMPILAPVEDDIRILRLMEEYVQIYFSKFLFPYTHIKIDQPRIRPDGTDELTYYSTIVNSAPPGSGIATSDRVTLEYLEQRGALKIMEIVYYWVTRVYSGLFMSSLDRGDGSTSNRNTATELSRSSRDFASLIIAEVEKSFNKILIPQLVSFNEKLRRKRSIRYDKLPRLVFKATDVDIRIATSRLALELFTANLIDRTEARDIAAMKQQIRDGETYFELVQKPLAELKPTVGGTGPAGSAGSVRGTSGGVNQHGAAGTGPTKDTVEEVLHDICDIAISEAPTLSRLINKFEKRLKAIYGENRNQSIVDAIVETHVETLKTLVDGIDISDGVSVFSMLPAMRATHRVIEDRLSMVDSILTQINGSGSVEFKLAAKADACEKCEGLDGNTFSLDDIRSLYFHRECMEVLPNE